MSDRQLLTKRRQKYEKKIKRIDKKYSRHPDTIREGVKILKQITNHKIVNKEFIDCILSFKDEHRCGLAEYRADEHRLLTYEWVNDLSFEIEIYLHQFHEEVDVHMHIVSGTKNGFNGTYNLLEDEKNIKKAYEEISNHPKYKGDLLKPFFDISWELAAELSYS